MNFIGFGAGGWGRSGVTHRFGILTMGLAAWLFGSMCLSGASCQLMDGLLAHAEIGEAFSAPAQAPPARLDIIERTPVVHVYGTPEEMGEQYGRLLGAALRALQRYLNAFVPADMKERMLAYGREHEKFLPDEIRRELQAITKASGMPYDVLATINIVPKMACSALAVWRPDKPGQAGLIMGRNADYFNMGFDDRGMLVVIRHPASGIGTASVNFLGMVGAFTGMNADGVAFGNMLVFNAAGPAGQDAGLTIQLAQRLAAQKARTARQMIDELRAYNHVIPMNVMVADAKEALVLETSPLGYIVRTNAGGVLAASNHFLDRRLASHDVLCLRYASLMSAGQAHKDGMSVDEMKKALFNARIPNINIQAVVFEPARHVMHVSINRNPASAGPYVALELDKLFAQPPASQPVQTPQAGNSR
ncbi:MAG: hypothetical protein HZA50_14695 [Planctomycetes bacterium]|nr:hypothetical protein [Planctomycetota bacterium]